MRNQDHLRRILRQYETHHDLHRPHRSLYEAAPLKPLPQPVDLDQYRIRKCACVGGAINEYHLVAWVDEVSGTYKPTPFLRLRWIGSPDELAIDIYKATTGQYSENEFPWSYGPLTGTPEQGIDETLAFTQARRPSSNYAASADRENRENRADGGSRVRT